MVLDWGMSPQLGHMALGGGQEHVFLGEEIARRREYSETTASEVDTAIKAVLAEAYAKAADLLRQYRPQLDRLAGALREREELAGTEVLAMLDADPTTIAPASSNDGQVDNVPIDFSPIDISQNAVGISCESRCT